MPLSEALDSPLPPMKAPGLAHALPPIPHAPSNLLSQSLRSCSYWPCWVISRVVSLGGRDEPSLTAPSPITSRRPLGGGGGGGAPRLSLMDPHAPPHPQSRPMSHVLPCSHVPPHPHAPCPASATGLPPPSLPPRHIATLSQLHQCRPSALLFRSRFQGQRHDVLACCFAEGDGVEALAADEEHHPRSQRCPIPMSLGVNAVGGGAFQGASPEVRGRLLRRVS